MPKSFLAQLLFLLFHSLVFQYLQHNPSCHDQHFINFSIGLWLLLWNTRRQTDHCMWLVCVWRGHNTQSLLSLLLFTSSGRSQKPPSSCMQQPHAHTYGHTASVLVCTSRQWVAVLAASPRRGQLCLTSGLDSIQTIRESLTGSLDEVIERGVRVQPCAVYFSVFIYFLLREVFYCLLLQCSVTPIDVTNSLLWA